MNFILFKRLVIDRQNNGERYNRDRNYGSSHRNGPVTDTPRDLIAHKLLARQITDIPEKLENGDLTAAEAAATLHEKYEAILRESGLANRYGSTYSSRNDSNPFFDPHQIELEGHTFNMGAFNEYVIETINTFAPPRKSTLCMTIIY